MRLALRSVPATRLPRVPWWAVAAIAVWGLIILGVVWGERSSGRTFTVCQLQRWTGRPCPTCGSTRAVLALSRGEFIEALVWNPLVVLALCAAALWLTLRAATGRSLCLDADRAGVRLLWALGALAVLLNWAWIWERA